MNDRTSEDRTAPPASASSSGRSWLPVARAVALVIGFCLLLLARDPGFFWNDDYQVYHLPGLSDVARAWEAGEWPLLSPSSWFGGALAGEYQHGIFSIFSNLVVLVVFNLGLPLPAIAAMFSMIHLAVLAAGVFALARHRGLSEDLATVAAIVASLNGWIICWGATDWISTLTSFAWVPWAWWALERALEKQRGPARFLLPGFFFYLILTAGWPLSVLMAGFVSLFAPAPAVFDQRSLRALWPVVAAWLWGVALATPALLMLLEHLGAGERAAHQGVEWGWVVPPTALIGVFFPSYVTEWSGWGGPSDRPAIELACGVVLPLALIVALFRLRGNFVRAFRWDLAAFGCVLLLTVLPSLAPFRYSYRWLPLFHLLLGLVGSQALASLRGDERGHRDANPHRSAPRITSLGLVVATLGFLVLEKLALIVTISLIAYLDLGYQALFLALLLGLAVPLVLRLRRSADSLTSAAWKESLVRWSPCCVVLLSLWSTYSQVETRWVARWDFPESLHRIEPLDPEITYLSVYSKDEAYRRDPELSQFIRPGNTAMLSGARMVNGYSPIMPAGFRQVLEMRSHLGFTYQTGTYRMLEQDAGPGGLLQLMAVDGLVLAESWSDKAADLEAQGWALAHASAHGVVLHRARQRSPSVRSLPAVEITGTRELIAKRILERGATPVPLLLLRSDSSPEEGFVEYAPAKIELRRSSRLSVEALVDTRGAELDSLVLFSRPWYPGYRATLDGRPLKVEALNLIMPAVEVPADAKGLLVLEYAPASFRLGLAVSALAVMLGVGLLVMGERRRG